MSPTLEGDTTLRVARLLEEGSGAELRELVADLDAELTAPVEAGAEELLAGWLRRRGGRELSHRSRVFWELVLSTPAGPAHPLAAELWPLASPGP